MLRLILIRLVRLILLVIFILILIPKLILILLFSIKQICKRDFVLGMPSSFPDSYTFRSTYKMMII